MHYCLFLFVLPLKVLQFVATQMAGLWFGRQAEVKPLPGTSISDGSKIQHLRRPWRFPDEYLGKPMVKRYNPPRGVCVCVRKQLLRFCIWSALRKSWTGTVLPLLGLVRAWAKTCLNSRCSEVTVVPQPRPARPWGQFEALMKWSTGATRITEDTFNEFVSDLHRNTSKDAFPHRSWTWINVIPYM